MRKLILISAFVFATVAASTSVQAGDGRNLTLAANDAPVAATAKTEEVKPEAAIADTAKPEAGKKHASKSQHKTQARHEGDEAKARRIAARYGVYW
jgi:hypothetical protein